MLMYFFISSALKCFDNKTIALNIYLLVLSVTKIKYDISSLCLRRGNNNVRQNLERNTNINQNILDNKMYDLNIHETNTIQE